MIRLLIVDDLPSARSGLRVLFRSKADILVVGEAESGPQAVDMVASMRPNVVLMDVRMPGGDGITAAREIIGASARKTAVVIMTTFDEDEQLFAALEAGASGFVPKNATAGELAAAVRLAAAGKSMLSPAVTSRVIAEFARRGRLQAGEPPEFDSAGRLALPSVNGSGPVTLTRREYDVLQHLARGLGDTEIARALHVESSTVKWHLTQLRAKTGSRSRTAILVWAIKAGVA